MTDDTLLPFSFLAVRGKKLTAAFDGGRITSDGGVMLLSAAERRLGLVDRLVAVIPDPRDPERITHSLTDILRARIFAIACSYEDANDLDSLPIPPSSLPVAACPTPAPTCARSRPCRGSRTCRTCAS
jgi:hypothetical protein